MSRYICIDGIETLIELEDALKYAPSIDIVRCKECRFYLTDEGKCTRTIWTYDWHRPKTKADDFCSYGERREP